MKQSLQLRLGQHLTMTPQLQQAIRLLQLSTVELQTEIQEALESNPMLEENSDEGQASDDSNSNSDQETRDTYSESSSEFEASDSSSQIKNEEMPSDLPVDTTWEDTYDYTPSLTSSSNYNSVIINSGNLTNR